MKFSIIFSQEKKTILIWNDATSIPAFKVGESVWIEKTIHPEWAGEYPKDLDLTEFEIMGISHFVGCTYQKEITSTYDMMIEIRPKANLEKRVDETS